MKKNYPFLIETPTSSSKNHFPILLQLGVLLLILGGIFGSLIFKGILVNETPTPESSGEYPQDNNLYPITATLQNFDDVKLQAKAAYVWDIKAQRALYSKNAEEKLPLASITKLMTAMLAHELIDTEKNATVPLSATQQESGSGLLAGEKLKVESLLQLALVSSSNDAAYTLGESAGAQLGEGNANAQFVKGMNIRAEELNLNTLEFWNTTGLDLSPSKPGAVGSARDVSFLMEYIVRNYPDIIGDTQKGALRVYNTDGDYHDAINTNDAVNRIPNLIGSKTGYTDLAGGNLTVAFDIGFDRPIVVTVLGSTREERFSDVLKLVNAVQNSVVIDE